MERPQIFDLSRADDRAALDRLAAEGRIRCRRDTLRAQLVELVKTRAHGWPLSADELDRRIESLLAGCPERAWGCWVFFPWSGDLVHLLPVDAFRELRTDRNRHKITDDEQATLRAARIGIVGLSVGSTSALTLALEGIGSHFRLADFDALELSNMNRIFASVADLGTPKVELAARALYEIDPYLEIELFPEGVTEDSCERFLGGDGGAPLTLLVEECDDLEVKVALRERARAHGIPVVMETSDGGLLDIERFDREPARPVLHGLLGDTTARSLRGLSVEAKVPLVMRVLDPAWISPRAAASMVEIGETVSTWPQLGSDVVLGGALVASAARRLLLGELTSSGRFRVSLDEAIRDGREALGTPTWPPELPVSPQERVTAASSPEEEIIRRACLAPSAGNVQPWRFALGGGELCCDLADERRSAYLASDAGDLLALGAALENAVLASAALGFETQVRTHSRGWSLQLRRGSPAVDPLAAQIEARRTNRAAGSGELLAPAHARALLDAAGAGARLRIVTDRAELRRAGEAIGALERLQILNPELSPRLLHEMRWSPSEARRSGTGLDVDTLQLAPLERAGLTLLRGADARAILRSVGGGARIARGNADTVAKAAGLAVLASGGDALAAGRVLERVWLAATAAGIGIHPLGTPADLWTRVVGGDRCGFDPHELATASEACAVVERILGFHPGEPPLVVLRLAYAPPPAERSLRLPVERVTARS